MQLAAATGDRAEDISPYLKGRSRLLPLPLDEPRVGIVFPVHGWMPPTPVLKFCSMLHVPPGVYRYAVCTCGDDCGKAMDFFARAFAVDAAWSVQMPNTYVPMFNLDADDVCRGKIAAARRLLPSIARSVLAARSVCQVHEGHFPRLKSYILYPLFCRFCIRPHRLRAEDGCVSCGRCVSSCPMQNIRLVDGRPVWGDDCIHCMACLHRCPKQVIQCGKATRSKGRYHLEDYL